MSRLGQEGGQYEDPTSPNATFRTLAKIASTTLAVYMIYSGLMLGVVPCGTLGLANLGKRFIHAEQAGIPEACVPTPYGYDGQFYWAASLTLWSGILRGHLGNNHGDSVVTYDVPATRLQRIGLSFLASITGGGRPVPTATSMLVIELLAVTGIAVASATIFAGLGFSPWYGLALAFYPGLAVSTAQLLTEPLALMGLIVGLALYFRRRWIPAGIALCLSVLSRETTLLAVLVTLAASLAYGGFTRRERYQAVACCAAPACIFACWHLYVAFLTGHLATEESALHNLGPPVVGLVAAVKLLWPPNSAINLLSLGFLVAALGLIGVLVALNVQLYRNRVEFVLRTMAGIFFGYFCLMIFYSSNHFENHPNLLRSISDGVVTGMFGAIIWLDNKRRLRTAFMICIATGWCVAAAFSIYTGSHRSHEVTSVRSLTDGCPALPLLNKLGAHLRFPSSIPCPGSKSPSTVNHRNWNQKPTCPCCGLCATSSA